MLIENANFRKQKMLRIDFLFLTEGIQKCDMLFLENSFYM